MAFLGAVVFGAVIGLVNVRLNDKKDKTELAGLFKQLQYQMNPRLDEIRS